RDDLVTGVQTCALPISKHGGSCPRRPSMTTSASNTSPGTADVFTGIIEELGSVRSIDRREGGARLEIAASTVLADARAGDSIAEIGRASWRGGAEAGGG